MTNDFYLHFKSITIVFQTLIEVHFSTNTIQYQIGTTNKTDKENYGNC